MFGDAGIQRHHALSVYCSPAAVHAYNQWVGYPMRNLFENQYGTTVDSIVSAYNAKLIEPQLFPLGVFDVRAVIANGSEDDAFFVSVDPASNNWHALLSAQLQRTTGIARATLVDQSGNFIDTNDVSKLIATHKQLFTVAASDQVEQIEEEFVGAKITASMPVDAQLSVYAKALAKRVYVSNNPVDLRPLIDERVAAFNLAVSVGKNKGLDAVLEATFGNRRSEFYTRVAAYIRSSVRTAVTVLQNTKSPVEMLRRVFVEEFEDVSFQDWIESALASSSETASEEEWSSSDGEEVVIGDSIDCEYDSYSDLMDSDEEESSLGAKFSALKKAARNVVSRSKYVSFKLERSAQESAPQPFSWMGTTTLEPGDIIRTVVHAAKPKKEPLLKFKKKNKKVKELPTSVIVDFQMRNRRAPSSPWLIVQTVEVLLPESGKIDGPMFAVPLDDQAFRVVVSTRRPGAGWQMVDVEGEYEFNVDAFGTKSASRRNYPVTWEQVRAVRYNQELRSRYNVPEFVFRARLVDTEPLPFKRKVTGEIVDYFDAGAQQRIEDARQSSVREQREEGVQAYFEKMEQRVSYKAYAINEVRHVVWALNNNMTYESEFLAGAGDYDSEYVEAMAASIDARLGVKSATQQRYKRQMELGRRAEKEAPVDAKYVMIPTQPARTEEISEDTAARFAAGVRFARPNVSRRAVTEQPTARARLAPIPIVTPVVTITPPAAVTTPTSAVVAPPVPIVTQQDIDINRNAKKAKKLFKAYKLIVDGLPIFDQKTTDTANQLELDLDALTLPVPTVTDANVDRVRAGATVLANSGQAFDNVRNTVESTLKQLVDGYRVTIKTLTNGADVAAGEALLAAYDLKYKAFFNKATFDTSNDVVIAVKDLMNFVNNQSSAAASSSSSGKRGKKKPKTPPPAPVTEQISIDALFEQLAEEQARVEASFIEDAIDYVIMTGDAIRHGFDKMVSTLIAKRNPIFQLNRRYIIIMPDEAVWRRYMSAFRTGTADVSDFLHDYTFEVLPGGLFAHSRRVSLTSLNGRNTVELKRTYDTKRNTTTIQLRTLGGRRYTGTLDTHAYSTDYKIHSVKMAGWPGFSS